MELRRRRALIPVLLGIAACAPSDAPDAGGVAGGAEGIRITDARGATLVLPGPATRVLSLVPSVTETLVELGATRVLVGRTDYDTLSALKGLPSVGGGLGPNLERVRTLEPQVVVTFAGESDPRTSQGLAAFGIPTFAVRPDRLQDVPPIVRQLGILTGRRDTADSLVASMEGELAAVAAAVRHLPRLRAAYLLGGSPLLAAGPGTFVSDLMVLAGADNVLDDLSGLYAPVSPEVLRIRAMDVILVGEGTPLDPRLTSGRRVEEIPAWVEIPGPRLGEAAWVVARALRPDLHGDG